MHPRKSGFKRKLDSTEDTIEYKDADQHDVAERNIKTKTQKITESVIVHPTSQCSQDAVEMFIEAIKYIRSTDFDTWKYIDEYRKFIVTGHASSILQSIERFNIAGILYQIVCTYFSDSQILTRDQDCDLWSLCKKRNGFGASVCHNNKIETTRCQINHAKWNTYKRLFREIVIRLCEISTVMFHLNGHGWSDSPFSDSPFSRSTLVSEVCLELLEMYSQTKSLENYPKTTQCIMQFKAEFNNPHALFLTFSFVDITIFRKLLQYSSPNVLNDQNPHPLLANVHDNERMQVLLGSCDIDGSRMILTGELIRFLSEGKCAENHLTVARRILREQTRYQNNVKPVFYKITHCCIPIRDLIDISFFYLMKKSP